MAGRIRESRRWSSISGQNLLGSRLKDLRTVLAILRRRQDIDGQRIAIWGDSFTPPNPANLWLDELENEGGPQIQRRAEPMGAHLALLTALYDDGIRAVVARGGLAGYLGVLEDPFAYMPIEDIVRGILKTGDIADIAASLAPRPVRLEGLVNGRNIRSDQAALEKTFHPARETYRETRAEGRLTLHVEDVDVASWLMEQLK